MADPWRLYDELIDGIDGDAVATAGTIGLRWYRVTTSEGGIGMALAMPYHGRPPELAVPTFAGMRLKDLAASAKSWNLAEAGIGMAALNAWYAQSCARGGERLHPERRQRVA